MQQRHPHPLTLATDLDGTLIPFPQIEQNAEDLQKLKQHLLGSDVALVFATGRHLRSILSALETFALPTPNWIIADVGTSIYEFNAQGWELIEDYAKHLEASIGSMTLTEIRRQFEKFDDLTLQAPEKQGRFKLSYYCPRETFHQVAKRLQVELDASNAPFAITHSLDPFTTHGLIDVLPRAASKGAALTWWADYMQLPPSSVIFAGDSGNDLAALTAGFRSIVVANADQELIDAVRAAHLAAGWIDRLFVAEKIATSGVLEGCHWYGMF